MRNYLSLLLLLSSSLLPAQILSKFESEEFKGEILAPEDCRFSNMYPDIELNCRDIKIMISLLEQTDDQEPIFLYYTKVNNNLIQVSLSISRKNLLTSREEKIDLIKSIINTLKLE